MLLARSLQSTSPHRSPASKVLLGVNFTSTISLGWLILTIVLFLVGGVLGIRGKRMQDYKENAARWRGLYELADTERKEVQAKLEECTKELIACRELVTKLDAMQMPVKIVELLNESVRRIDENSKLRMAETVERLQNESELARERHEAILAIASEIKGALERVAIHKP